jgi:hypothetical protein
VSEHEESAKEENETSLKSHCDTEEEPKSRGCEEEGDQDNTDAKEKDVESETPKLSTTSRRSSKKQTTEEVGGSNIQAASPGDADWKEDKSFWENEEGKVSIAYIMLQLALEITCPSLFLLHPIHIIILTASVCAVHKKIRIRNNPFVESVPGYSFRGHRFDSWHYQIFWEVVGLEQGPLSLVTTIEELLRRNIISSSLETKSMTVGIRCADHVTPSIC